MARHGGKKKLLNRGSFVMRINQQLLFCCFSVLSCFSLFSSSLFCGPPPPPLHVAAVRKEREPYQSAAISDECLRKSTISFLIPIPSLSFFLVLFRIRFFFLFFDNTVLGFRARALDESMNACIHYSFEFPYAWWIMCSGICTVRPDERVRVSSEGEKRKIQSNWPTKSS